jgi:hypothetical protein
VLLRGGEVDAILDFETAYGTLEWIGEKSQVWILEAKSHK